MRKWGLSNRLVLYVKSEKIFRTQYSEGVPGHPCTAANRASEIVCDYKPRDKEAMDFLEKEGILYRLIDLSNCSIMFNLKAKMLGLNETPTLVLSGRRIKGTKNIESVIHEIKVSK